MSKRWKALCLAVVFGCAGNIWAEAPVTFGDAALEAAVRTQWETATGETLSTPPLDTELADSRFSELVARNAAISDLSGLEACTALTKLDLAYNDVADLTPLAGLISLTHLELGIGNPLTEGMQGFPGPGANLITDISPLAGLVHLEYLNLVGNEGITDISAISGMDVLEQFWVGFSTIADWSPLDDVKDTMTLFATFSCGFSDSEMPYLAAMSNLFVLGFFAEPGVTDISSLDALNLQFLTAAWTGVTDVSVASNWSGLFQLFIAGSPVTTLGDLSGLTNLQQFMAWECQISDLSGLSGLTGLQQVDLKDNQIVDIAAIETWTGIRELNLKENLITDIQALVDNPGLGGDDRVNLESNPLSQDAACDQLPALRAKFNSGENVQATAICGPVATLTIAVTGTGDTYPDPGIHQYPQGESAWVNARPISGSGYAFDHWEGDVPAGAEITSNSLQLVMDTDKTLTAVYVTPGDYTLTLEKTGSGAANGSLSPDPGVISFKANRVAELNYWTEDNGSVSYFAGWSGDVTGYARNVSLLMDGDKTVTATFASSGYVLRINRNGEGGIDSFSTDEDIRLVAGASFNVQAFGWSGYQFDHWEGDVPAGANATDNPLAIVMDQNRNLTAVFVQGDRALTIATGGTGSGTTNPSPGTHYYFDGQYAWVTAIPTDGSAFVQWEGDIGTANATNQGINLLMDQNRSITAVFGPAAWTLTLQKTGNGNTDPVTGVYGFSNNAQTQVRANLISGGDAFGQWTGDIPEDQDITNTALSLTMNQNRTLTAEFVTGDFTLNIEKSGAGCGTPSPGLGAYAYVSGRTAYVSANVCFGSFFGGWSGDVSSFQPSLEIPMDEDMSVTANYATSGYLLTVSRTGQGWINFNDGEAGFVAGAEVALSVSGTPQGWSFANWSGDLPDGVDPEAESIEVLMDQDRAITANFTQNPPKTLTIIIEGSGQTSPAGAAAPGTGHEYPQGEQAYLEALRGQGGWAFSHWSGDIGGNNPASYRINVTMDADKTVTAHYVQADYILTIAYTGNGSTWPEPGIYGYVSGSEAEFGANLVAGGDAFDQWTGDIPSGSNPQETHHRITMDQDRTLTAAFVAGDYVLTINPIAGGGAAWLDPQPGAYSYITGRTARAEIRLNDNMFWGGWTGGVSSFDTLLRFTITSNVAVTPNVTSTGYYLTVSSSDPSLGTTEPSGMVGYAPGSVPTVTAEGQGGGFFDHWTGDLPDGVDANNPEIQVTMDQNRSITANFSEYDWYLFLQIQGEGTTDPAPGVHWYNDGQSATVRATPASGHVFLGWSGLTPEEGAPEMLEVTITLTEDRILTAIFLPSTVIVPDLSGMTQEEAETALSAVGLLLGQVDEEPSDLVLEGQVMTQDPAAGVEAAHGSAVDIVISTGDSGLGPHSADQDGNGQVNLTELLRVIQFFNSGGYRCVVAPATSEDGYLPGAGSDHDCGPHASDYNPQDWQVNLTELLRLIQFFNSGGYYECPGMNTEDGYCPGQAPV